MGSRQVALRIDKFAKIETFAYPDLQLPAVLANPAMFSLAAGHGHFLSTESQMGPNCLLTALQIKWSNGNFFSVSLTLRLISCLCCLHSAASVRCGGLLVGLDYQLVIFEQIHLPPNPKS